MRTITQRFSYGVIVELEALGGDADGPHIASRVWRDAGSYRFRGTLSDVLEQHALTDPIAGARWPVPATIAQNIERWAQRHMP